MAHAGLVSMIAGNKEIELDAGEVPPLQEVSSHDPLLPLKRLVRRLQPRERPSVPPELHNERVLYAEMFFQAFAGAGALSFTSVFLVRLGAPNFLVGLFSSLPALMVILTVLPMGAFVQRQSDLVKVTNWGRMIFRAVIATFGFLVYLPAGLAPYVMVVAESLIAVPSSALNIAHSTILGRATTPRRRPAMLSTRLAVHGFTAAFVGFAAGQWLDWAPFPLNYQILFISALVAGLGSVFTLLRLRLPRVSPEPRQQRSRAGIREMIELIKATPAFKRYASATFLFRVGVHIPMALFSIYRVRTLGASDAWIGILFMVERLISVGVYILLSRVLTQPRFRDRLWLSSVGLSLLPFAMALATTPEQLLLSSAVAGLFGPGTEVFLTNTLFQVSTEENRPTFVAANSFLANITAFGAPLVGTFIADATDIRLALIVATVVRAMGGIAFWLLKVGREDRVAEDTT